jgi:hypothetical protein
MKDFSISGWFMPNRNALTKPNLRFRADDQPFPYSNPGRIRPLSGAKIRHREGLAAIQSEPTLQAKYPILGFISSSETAIERQYRRHMSNGNPTLSSKSVGGEFVLAAHRWMSHRERIEVTIED